LIEKKRTLRAKNQGPGLRKHTGSYGVFVCTDAVWIEGLSGRAAIARGRSHNRRRRFFS
jgi:hypothetical protein